MTMIEMLLAEVEREAERSKRALEQVPDDKYDWKPHERSMVFGYVALMVAQIPSWVGMIVTEDELDLAPKDGPKHKPEELRTSAELLKALDVAVTQAREALKGTSEAHLMTPWRLLVGGKTVLEISRHVMIRETLSHLAHHRGQMTVYLRLMGAKVPALYGPSADDSRYD